MREPNEATPAILIEALAKCGEKEKTLRARVAALEATILGLRSLGEAAYHEGFSHGESSASAFEWGAASSKYDTWEHSDAKEALAKVSVATK